MIETKELSVVYDQSVHALKDVDLHVKENEIVAIIGQNGSGKSTLLKSCVGLLTYKGQLNITGIPVVKENYQSIREKIGYIFQDPQHQMFMGNVYDDLAFGLINQGKSEEEIKKRIEDISKYLQIDDLLNKSNFKLSGGQKRMVAIASILIMEPDIILMDEPTAFLDPVSRRRVINTMKDFHKTTVIATHDLDMALDIANRVILINNGQIIADGSVEDILRNKDLLERNGLELPFRYQR